MNTANGNRVTVPRVRRYSTGEMEKKIHRPHRCFIWDSMTRPGDERNRASPPSVLLFTLGWFVFASVHDISTPDGIANKAKEAQRQAQNYRGKDRIAPPHAT